MTRGTARTEPSNCRWAARPSAVAVGLPASLSVPAVPAVPVAPADLGDRVAADPHSHRRRLGSRDVGAASGSAGSVACSSWC